MDYDFFTDDELSCSCGCDLQMDRDFMRKLITFRRHCGFGFNVSSGARCVAFNKSIGASEKSYHTKGRAVDIAISRVNAKILIEDAGTYGFHGLGISQKGSNRFIHIDDRPYDEDALWSY